MTAFNIVRFRVRPEFEKDFVEAHRNMQRTFPGARRFSLIKTGDGAYCIVGEWESFDSIVAARPNMVANLNNIRDMLMDFGMGTGVTDPVSGEAVIDMWAGVKGGRKAKAKGTRKAKAKKRPTKKAKKKKAKKKKARRR